MLIQKLVPASVENSFLFDSHIRNQRYSFDWMLGDQSLKKCSHFGECTQDICGKLVLKIEKNKEDSCPLNLPRYADISTPTTMSARSAPLNVYRRKKQRKPPSRCPTQGCNHTLGDGSNPSVSSESLTTNAVPVNVEKHGNGDVDYKSGYCNECSDGSLKSDTGRGLDHCSFDDSCSSSKLNVDITTSHSLKPEVDDTVECSSSSGVRMWDNNMSEKDILVSILKNMGLLQKVRQDQASSANNNNGMITEAVTCRVCDCSDSTLKMLICDKCEDAFHASCCNPRIRRMPIHEWSCNSCTKKERKLLVEKNLSNESSRSNVELNPIAAMLKESETYYSTVRLGCGFQAEIPTWSGPAIDEIRSLDKSAKEMMESEYLNLGNSIRKFSSSLVGNWLQCQTVIHDVGEGIDGTICGKWRRAPLFEVESDNWECFCAILWDPLHADCAVSQELPTDEVLKQLKYIETLRPRLGGGGKKRKSDVDSQDSKQV